jgi:ABC-type polysaccharide/polyol phosphate transport system ATPase subunit
MFFKNPQAAAGDFWALRNIYMTIDKGEIMGVIGRNGAGKTTLLNIIAGILPPSEGEVTVNGKTSSLLTLGAGFQDEFTGKENIYLHASLLGLRKQEVEERFLSILEFSELGDFINAPLGSYSNGMRMRLGFSVAIHNDFDILLTDEILMVGDLYFQKKSFEKMLEFKKQGKSMIIVTQDMEAINKLCDKTYLLEDGSIIFEGDTRSAVERYQMLLNKKKILSETSRLDMVKETKRWATDMVEWGERKDTGEVKIKGVTIFNKWGIKTNRVRPKEKIKVRISFEAKEEIDDFHFGVAIFREDGVYCYGPNTKFDSLAIKRMGKGKGNFEFECKELLLMPSNYYLSIAIWDKNETLAYDYHKGCYKLEIVGTHMFGQLLCLPYSWGNPLPISPKITDKTEYYPNLDYLIDRWGTELKNDFITLESVKFLNIYGGEDSVFVTGREIKIKVDLKMDKPLNQALILWLGIYRSDGIYCHGSMKELTCHGINSEVLFYPKLRLLPGGYRVSAGVWDPAAGKFLLFSHGLYPFNMVSDKRDHGTVYLEHNWKFKIPRGKKG